MFKLSYQLVLALHRSFATIMRMKTLREWNGDSNELVFDALKKYGLTPKNIELSKFEALSPDSFVWYFRVNNTDEEYCLYAEDYVPDLEHVVSVVIDNSPEWYESPSYELVKLVGDAEAGFSFTSGFDRVFLAKGA